MERRVVTVFGGSGFIGRHVVRQLAGDGWIVRVLVRNPERAAFLKMYGEPGQIVPMYGDVADAASVAGAITDSSAVINLVGILYEKGRRTFQRIHVEGAANVAKASADAVVDRTRAYVGHRRRPGFAGGIRTNQGGRRAGRAGRVSASHHHPAVGCVRAGG